MTIAIENNAAGRAWTRVEWPGRASWLGLVALCPIALLIGAVAMQSVDLLFSQVGRKETYALFASASYYAVLMNTVLYALMSTVIALVLGVQIAWFAERIAGPGAGLIRIAMIAGTIVPGFFVAMGWLLLGHPRIGFLASLGLPVNTTSLIGMAVTQGLALASLVFVMMAPSMSALSKSLEESAAIHGIGRVGIWRHIWLPLLKPALIATTSVIFLVSFAAFDIPAVLGLSNRVILYSTFVYELITPASGVPQYGLAAASSIPVLVMAVVLTLVNLHFTKAADAFAVVGGKTQMVSARPPARRVLVGCWMLFGSYIVLTVVLPMLAVAWASLLPYYRAPSLQAVSNLGVSQYKELFSPQFWSSALNTAIFAVAAPTLTVGLGFLVAWSGARSSRQVRYILDIVSFLPLAIPSAVLAVGATAIALQFGAALPIYGTLTLIIIVEAVARIPIASRAIGSALLQLNKEMDEAGRVFGLHALNRVLRITTPLIMPALVYSWFLLAMLSYRELAVPALLASKGNVTISVYTFGLLSTGSFGRAAALTLTVLATIAVLALLAYGTRRLLGRNPSK